MRHPQSKSVLCPFYSCEEDVKIHCEGVEPRTSIHLTFRSPTELIVYRQKYCDKDFGGCRLAKMLYKKYNQREVHNETKRGT